MAIARFIKVKASPLALNNLMFAVVALENVGLALASHKHPHKPAIARAKAAHLYLSQLSASLSNKLSELEGAEACVIADEVRQ